MRVSFDSGSDDLRQLANSLMAESERMWAAVAELDRRIASTGWEGPAATEFRTLWDSQRDELSRIAALLKQAGDAMERQATHLSQEGW